MADFAEWGEAIARALGYKPLQFINTYFENIGEQNIEIIEANPFAEAISKFLDYDKAVMDKFTTAIYQQS